jgi:terminase small subunit / prophage DNA-packing protein
VIDLKAQIKQIEFGELVGISQPAVSDLLSRKVLSSGAPVGQWLLEYCGNLREVAAGRATNGELDLASERARLAKEQADKVAMQNAERRGELAPVSAMEMVLAAVGSKVGKILDTIPGLIRRRVPGAGSDVIEAIEADIAKCRNMAASMTLASLSDDDDATEEVEIEA